MKVYDVTVTREDNLWVADIHDDDLGPAATDTENFSDLDDEVRDLIAGLTDGDPDSFDIRWRYEINGKDVTEQLSRLFAIERDLRQAQLKRDRAREEALVALTSAGLSQRATAGVVGISHQRVNQLAKR